MPKKIKKYCFKNLNFRQNQKSEVKFLGKNQKYNVFPAANSRTKEMECNQILYIRNRARKISFLG